MDLIDGDRFVDVGYEPGRVGSCGRGGRVVVEVDQTRRMLIGSDLSNECALADLAGSKDGDSAAVGQRVHNVATEVAVEQALGHGQIVAALPDGLGLS